MKSLMGIKCPFFCPKCNTRLKITRLTVSLFCPECRITIKNLKKLNTNNIFLEWYKNLKKEKPVRKNRNNKIPYKKTEKHKNLW